MNKTVLRAIVYPIIAVKLFTEYVGWNFRDHYDDEVSMLSVLHLVSVRRIAFRCKTEATIKLNQNLSWLSRFNVKVEKAIKTVQHFMCEKDGFYGTAEKIYGIALAP